MKPFPEKSRAKEDVMEELKTSGNKDVKWRQGRTFSLVFYPGEEIYNVTKEAYTSYFSENGLNPSAFPSLRKFESESVAMVASLFHGTEETTGNMTSGGTESILLAVKTARDWARAEKPHIKEPEIILPTSAHPAFHKGCHYFDLKARLIDVRDDFRADPKAYEAAISENTVMLVASAPSYPQGVVDPIEDIGQVALKHNVLLHVDACVGGFMIPFLQMLGHPIPKFDFACEGVTSISADIHKYGYSSKGTSTIMYRTRELRNHQFHIYTDWPGGIYGSPTITGTRPGGAFAATWAVFNYLGIEGYKKVHARAMEAAQKIKEGVNAIDHIKILGDPDLTIMSIGSDDIDVYELSDHMSTKGWNLDRQQDPPSLHLTVSQIHLDYVDEFLADLKEMVQKTQKVNADKILKNAQVGFVTGMSKVLPENAFKKFQKFAASKSDLKPGSKSAALYGMMGTLKTNGTLHDMVLEVMNKLHSVEE